MIVKDEEGGLRRAVNSAKDIVDEVVIGVDRNSSDKTLEIAKEIADVCYEFDWTDDFSAARNTYLGKVSGDWILQLDGHEYVKKFNPIDWDKASKAGDAIRVQILMEDGTTIRAERIYKNGTKFHYKVHNSPVVKKVIADTEFLIMHDRFVQSQKALKTREKQRDKMIIGNLEGEKDPRSLYYTARQHLDMRRFDKAIRAYKKYLKSVVDKDETPGRIAEKRKVRFDLAKTYYLNKQYKKAIEEADEDLKEYFFLKGQIHATREDHPEAIKELLKAYATDPTGDGFNPVVDIDFLIWDFLSVSLFHMRQYEMAYTATQKALELKDDEQVRSNARVFAHHFRAVKEKGEKYYDRLFKDGYDTSRYADIYEIILKMLAKMDKPRVLEAGCGVGSLGKMIMDAGYKYKGFDFSKEAIKWSKKLGGDFYVGNVYDKKEFEDGDHDVIIATEVLEHVDDLKFLSNIRNGITFIGSVPNFGDVAHLRVYEDKQKDIIDRFSKHLTVEKVYFSQQLGIYVFNGTIKN